MLILGWAIPRRLTHFAQWFSLALLGQAAALQLIDAGPLLHYQHYRFFEGLLTGTDALLLLCLGAQTVLVAGGLKARLSAIRTWIGQRFRLWQLGAAAVVVFASGVAAVRDIPAFSAEFVFAGFVQLVNLGNIVLAAWALPPETLLDWRQRFDRLLGQPVASVEAQPGRLDRLAWLAALWVVAVAAFLSFFIYEAHPHIPDEVVYLYHARFLADGMLTLPAPPVPEAFATYLMEFKGQTWYPTTPPGWPAMLAIGVRMGAPWLVNPLLAGINVLLTYLLIRELYDLRTAQLTTLLLSISPWHIYMAMNFMTHTLTLTCALAGVLLVSWARRMDRVIWAGLAGIMVGMGTIIRPLDGIIAGGLIGLWLIGIGGRRLRIPAIVAFVLFSIITSAMVLPYNYALTGSPTTFPLNAYLDNHFGPGINDLGFGPNRGLDWPLQPFPGHSPLGALVNMDLNMFALNTELFGWSTGSLIVMALFVCAGRFVKSDRLMLVVIGFTVGAFSLYWYSGGPDFGARYWYLILVPCIALTVRGIQHVETLLRSGRSAVAGDNLGVYVAIALLCVIALLDFFPWRAVDKYHAYLRMRPEAQYLAQANHFGKSLVLVRGDEHPDYASAAIYNPLDLRAGVPIFAWDRGPDVRARLLAAFADRPVWIINGPTLTHRGFEVVAGPLAADKVAAEVHLHPRSASNGLRN